MFTEKKIKFTSNLGKTGKQFLPLPVSSKKSVPDWYKQMASFHEKKFDQPTVKKCMPFLDALSMGYIIKTGWDFLLKKSDTDKGWRMEMAFHKGVGPYLAERSIGIEHHQVHQYPKEGFNKDEIHVVLKLLSPWVITTPPGYSCLFVNPFNHLRPHFRVLEGVVDTDTYTMPVNFPMIPKKFEEDQKIIPAGTPIGMVIPFKRDPWKMDVVFEETSPDEISFATKTLIAFKRIYDNYKTKFWVKKNFD